MKIVRLSEITTLPPEQNLSPEELAKAYALARETFTAEDLQRYTELDQGIPMEDVLAELEETQKQIDQRSS